jgi:3-methylcrotonyl-CoA carboxylase alpha subunit
MPATVIGVSVAAGQVVTRGDVLVTLEAMKMEFALKAPRDGKVRAVQCRQGDLVQPGVPLVELE